MANGLARSTRPGIQASHLRLIDNTSYHPQETFSPYPALVSLQETHASEARTVSTGPNQPPPSRGHSNCRAPHGVVPARESCNRPPLAQAMLAWRRSQATEQGFRGQRQRFTTFNSIHNACGYW
ncbi:unnamed protein product [Ectocarpus sp. 13 AM-2016]